jgi:hypothetical protein
MIYKPLLLTVLCGWNTWFLSLREENRLRVFKERSLRIFGEPKREGVVEGWRKLHNEKLLVKYQYVTGILDQK